MDLSRILSSPVNSASPTTTAMASATHPTPKPAGRSDSPAPLGSENLVTPGSSTHAGPTSLRSPSVLNHGPSSPPQSLPQLSFAYQRHNPRPHTSDTRHPTSSSSQNSWHSVNTPRGHLHAEREAQMPPVVDVEEEDEPWQDLATPSRTNTSSFQNTPQEPVDLTTTPSPPPSSSHTQSHRPRKRRRLPSRGNDDDHESAEPGPSTHAPKRRRSIGRRRESVPRHVEAIDLVDVSDDDEIAVVLSRQRQEAVASQAAPTSSEQKPNGTKLTSISCTICMDDPTELTATACGHVFCRACLMNWLGSREHRTQRRPNCPTCRTPLTVAGQRKSWVPLEIMRKGKK